MKAEKRTKNAAIWLCTTAMFMALNIAMSSFGVPVPGGHLYLNDIVICLAAIILDPVAAFAVGGIGAFLGDFFFYPAPMFVSLVTHGLQAVVISLISHHALKASQISVGTRRIGRCRHNGRGIFARPRIYLQHTGIRNNKAAVSDIAGSGWRRARNVTLLELRCRQAV